MQSTSKAAQAAALTSRIAELHAHIELAGKLEKPALVALFTRELARVEAQLAPIAATLEPKAAKTKTPCAWAKEIRRFFAIAREHGLDRNEDRSRGALSLFLGRRIESRAELNGREWSICADAIRDGRLFW
jgi:hypothetical protein